MKRKGKDLKLSDLKGLKTKKGKRVPKKKVNRSRKSKQAKKSTLPPTLVLGGVEYNTPSKLRKLRYRGAIVNDEVKIVVYDLYLRFKKKHTLHDIVYRMYNVRNEYVYSAGRVIPNDLLGIACIEAMGIDGDYYYRSDVKNRILDVHNRRKNIQNFRFECFDCTTHETLKFVPSLVKVDEELSYFWEAREEYLEAVDSSTLMFGIWFVFEPLTRFAFVNFNEIILDGGDVSLFKDMVSAVKIKAGV